MHINQLARQYLRNFYPQNKYPSAIAEGGRNRIPYCRNEKILETATYTEEKETISVTLTEISAIGGNLLTQTL